MAVMESRAMAGVIHVDSGGPGVRVLTLDNPPMNPLGEALRARLMEVLAEAGADPAVRAILITGKGQGVLRRRRPEAGQAGHRRVGRFRPPA